jgi:hypothetical protein
VKLPPFLSPAQPLRGHRDSHEQKSDQRASNARARRKELTKTLRYHRAILTFCGVYTTRPADEEGENCSN